MRVIMVPVADRPECVAALKTTFPLAEALGASIQAFHVRPHRYSEVALPPEASFFVTGAALEQAAESTDAAAKQASTAARTMVAGLAEANGFSLVNRVNRDTERGIVWSEQVGYVQNLMSVLGPFADLLVVSRPKSKKSHIARQFMLSALMDTSRPVLILPHRGARKLGRRVVVAWDRTHQAMQAVVCALPLLRRAEHVSIFTSGVGKAEGPKARPLQDYLRAWGIDALVSKTRGAHVDAIKDIDEHMDSQSADLLVMGSYSRNRFRERVFGGVTDHMLTKARFPVLTVHR